MTALLSIKPEFASLIFAGRKRFEYRRTKFNRNVTRVIVYASAPISKVIGEFDVEGVLSDDVEDIWRATHHASGISEQFYYGYFSSKVMAYAIKIGSARLYDTPLGIKEHFGVCPPQSFVYLRNVCQTHLHDGGRQPNQGVSDLNASEVIVSGAGSDSRVPA